MTWNMGNLEETRGQEEAGRRGLLLERYSERCPEHVAQALLASLALLEQLLLRDRKDLHGRGPTEKKHMRRGMNVQHTSALRALGTACVEVLGYSSTGHPPSAWPERALRVVQELAEAYSERP